MLVRIRRNYNPFMLLVGIQSSSATVEYSLALPQKLNIEQPCNGVILHLDIKTKDLKTGVQQILVHEYL